MRRSDDAAHWLRPLAGSAAARARRSSLWNSILRLDWRAGGARGPARVASASAEVGAKEELKASGIRRRPGLETERTPIRAADVTRWLYRLSPETAAFREQVKELLQSEEFAPREGLSLEEQAARSYARFQLLRERLDLRLRDVQERPARLATVLELVGVLDGTLFAVMNIHYCLCGGSLLRHAAGGQLEEYLRELDELDSVGTFLATELGYGNNLVALQTRADFDVERGDLLLSTPCAEARKFMPNTGLAHVPKLGVVMARLFVRNVDHGVFPLLVRLRTRQGPCPGVSIMPLGDKPVFSLDNAITSFHAVRVPRHCLLLGEHSELSADGTFRSSIPGRRARFLRAIEQVQLGRLCLSGVGATLTGASAFVAIKYAEQRRTFAPRHPDVAVIEYRNHQRDVFSALAYAYASRCLVEYAHDKYVSTAEREQDYLFRITSATKSHVTYATDRFVRLCRERCGAAALLEENRLSIYAAQIQGLLTAEGDNHILLIKIARQMLMRQGYVRVAKVIPAPLGGLTEPARVLGLLRERERRLLNELRHAMAPARLPGQDLFAIWNENINLALETATAHASRLAAEAFWERATELESNHPALDLFRLFGLQELAPHLGYYLAEELLTRAELKAHRATVDQVCAALRPFALELASACDVPNAIIRAPLASDDYVEHYDRRARHFGLQQCLAGEASTQVAAARAMTPRPAVSSNPPTSTAHAR
jgi:acyl-CoA oxidase